MYPSGSAHSEDLQCSRPYYRHFSSPKKPVLSETSFTFSRDVLAIESAFDVVLRDV